MSLFTTKSSFKICASAKPNHVDSANDDWWLVAPLQETRVAKIVFIVLTATALHVCFILTLQKTDMKRCGR